MHTSRLQFAVKLAVGLVGGGGLPPVLSSTIVQAANAPPIGARGRSARRAGRRREPPSAATESTLPVFVPTAVDRTVWPAGHGPGQRSGRVLRRPVGQDDVTGDRHVARRRRVRGAGWTAPRWMPTPPPAPTRWCPSRPAAARCRARQLGNPTLTDEFASPAVATFSQAVVTMAVPPVLLPRGSIRRAPVSAVVRRAGGEQDQAVAGQSRRRAR